MSVPALNPSLPVDITIEVTRGSEQGAVYKIMAQKVSIGRSPDNDIVIKDPKCSRNQAVIEIDDHGLLLRNVSASVKVQVNGQPIDKIYLPENAVITVGETDLQIGLSQVTPTDMVEHLKAVPDMQHEHVPLQKKKNPLFYGVVALVAISLAYILFSDPTPKDVGSGIRTAESIQAEIQESQKITAALQNARYAKGKDSMQYIDAQSTYLKGFRDYREGHYARAITAFEAALALYPQHELSKRYLIQSRRKLDESVQNSMQEGSRYMEQGKYQLAKSAFRNVMILVRNPENTTYKEAKTKYDQCDSILEGSF